MPLAPDFALQQIVEAFVRVAVTQGNGNRKGLCGAVFLLMGAALEQIFPPALTSFVPQRNALT